LAATCTQLVVTGGAFAVSSWAPKVAMLSSPATAGSSHAALDAGRSPVASKKAACVSGWASQSTSFHADAALSLHWNTTRFASPLNETDWSRAGSTAVAYLSANPSPPSSSSWPRRNGPSTTMGAAPLTNSASVAPGDVSTSGFAMPSVKKLW